MRLLLILLLLPLVSNSQRLEWIRAFNDSTPKDIGTPIKLPTPWYKDFHNEIIAPYYVKNRVFVIKTDSQYRKIFATYRFTNDSLKASGLNKDEFYYKWMVQHHADSIPKIDFTRNELVLYSACPQCLAHCRHNGERHEPCHRNMCMFNYAWFVRKKDIVP
jgi:hypothetical protein